MLPLKGLMTTVFSDPNVSTRTAGPVPPASGTGSTAKTLPESSPPIVTTGVPLRYTATLTRIHRQAIWNVSQSGSLNENSGAKVTPSWEISIVRAASKGPSTTMVRVAPIMETSTAAPVPLPGGTGRLTKTLGIYPLLYCANTPP
jgi:hypothetical protein